MPSGKVFIWVYTPNAGRSNPHRVASYDLVRNKFCKSSVTTVLVYA